MPHSGGGRKLKVGRGVRGGPDIQCPQFLIIKFQIHQYFLIIISKFKERRLLRKSYNECYSHINNSYLIENIP